MLISLVKLCSNVLYTVATFTLATASNRHCYSVTLLQCVFRCYSAYFVATAFIAPLSSKSLLQSQKSLLQCMTLLQRHHNHCYRVIQVNLLQCTPESLLQSQQSTIATALLISLLQSVISSLQCTMVLFAPLSSK